MSDWFRRVSADISELPNAMAYYENELASARLETSIKGNLEMNSRLMPGIVEHRFNQLQEIEAILEWLNVQLRKTKTRVFKKFLEGYNKVLSSRDADKYADGDSEVIEWQLLINEFAMVRNKYLGLMKAIDSKQFQINNIVKLRVAGMDDTVLG
jgi:CRISPR/Cas system CSM-associated protein Csm2 small subunit